MSLRIECARSRAVRASGGSRLNRVSRRVRYGPRTTSDLRGMSYSAGVIHETARAGADARANPSAQWEPRGAASSLVTPRFFVAGWMPTKLSCAVRQGAARALEEIG